MLSVGGHKGGLPLSTIVDIVDRHSYRTRHVAWNERGVQKGLPPDVVTLMIGEPKQGFWFNMKRGYVPEYDVRKAAWVEDDSQVLEDLHRLGWIGEGFRPDASSMFHETNLVKTHKPKLLYTGWRSMVRLLIVHHLVRDHPDIEELLGARDYREAILTRQRWDAAKAVDITAD